MKALKYLLVKEYKQMFRNRILPIVFVLLPIAMMNVVPRIATQEVSNISMAIVDQDHSTLSSRLVQKLSSSKYFDLFGTYGTYQQAYEQMQIGTVDFIVTIEDDFESNLYRTGKAEVMVSANAVNGMKGGLGGNYLTQIIAQYSKELNSETGISGQLPFRVEPRYLYNPELNYKPYMIPALLSMTLVLLVGFLPALNVVGEKERGTIEQINVTPVGRMEFILSKMIPYWTVGLFIVGISILMAWAIHGVAPQGSLVSIFLFNMVYVVVISSLGLIVSNYSDNMRQAAMVMFFFIIIFILTSGLLSPLSSMPDWAKELTRLNPLRYIITAMRDLYLKGSTFAQLLPQFIPLCIYALISSIIAVWSFKKNNS